MITQCKQKEDTPETRLNLRLALDSCECMYDAMSKWASTGAPDRQPRLMLHIEHNPLSALEFVLRLHQIVQIYIEVGPAAAKDETAARKYNVENRLDRLQKAVNLNRMHGNGQ